jgi:hypothetical protein
MTPTYNDSVFINCPFDDQYRPLLEAIVFTVYRCGFYPLSALSEDNALDNRLQKIENLIAKCRYGIHDLSRTEVNAAGFPRFNMPFELGIFFGAKKFGNKIQKSKNALILIRERYTYQQYISDLNGVDPKAHNENQTSVIRHTRDWLVTASRRELIPGHTLIITDFENFQNYLPPVLADLNLDRHTLMFNDLCVVIEEFLKTLL